MAWLSRKLVARFRGASQMKAIILFYLAVSLRLTHELDAVAHAEWRLLDFLRGLGDSVAYPIFLVILIFRS